MASEALTRRGALRVNVVTPKGPIVHAEAAASVTAPGRLGELEVLPGHVPFLTELHPGVLSIGDKGAGRKVLAVSTGFLSIDAAGEVQVLVEQAVLAENADLEAARKVVADLAPKLKDWKQDLGAEWKNLKAQHDWAQAQLEGDRLRRLSS